jgi:hypothetical protein
VSLGLVLGAFFGFSEDLATLLLVVLKEEYLVDSGLGFELGIGAEAEAVPGEEGQSRDQWPGRPHL